MNKLLAWKSSDLSASEWQALSLSMFSFCGEAGVQSRHCG